MYKTLFYSFPLVAAQIFFIGHARAADNGIAATIHTLRAEAGGRICQDGHFHVGTSPAIDNRDKALNYALRNWSQFTVLEYGTDWGNFQSAGDRSTDCAREGSQWVCKVKGRPCRVGMSTAAR